MHRGDWTTAYRFAVLILLVYIAMTSEKTHDLADAARVNAARALGAAKDAASYAADAQQAASDCGR